MTPIVQHHPVGAKTPGLPRFAGRRPVAPRRLRVCAPWCGPRSVSSSRSAAGLLVAYVGLAVSISGQDRLVGGLVLVLGLWLMVAAPVVHDRLHRERGEESHAAVGQGRPQEAALVAGPLGRVAGAGSELAEPDPPYGVVRALLQHQRRPAPGRLDVLQQVRLVDLGPDAPARSRAPRRRTARRTGGSTTRGRRTRSRAAAGTARRTTGGRRRSPRRRRPRSRSSPTRSSGSARRPAGRGGCSTLSPSTIRMSGLRTTTDSPGTTS